jgi:hypothetical protein
MMPQTEAQRHHEKTDQTEPLPPDLLAQVLVCAETLNSIIVGGQALNIWGEHYFDRASEELRPFTPFQSKDIDFFGTAGDAAELARMLDAEFRTPSLDNVATPSSALIEIRLQGRLYFIDFLRSVAGLDTGVMQSRARTLSIPHPHPNGNHPDIEVLVLNPVDLLKSRIAGVTVLRREDNGARRQLAAAPVVAREYVKELLETSQAVPEMLDEAQDAVREIIEIGRDGHNDAVLVVHGVDILAEMTKLADHPVWDPRFADHQIRQACAQAVEQRSGRIDETRRRLEGRGQRAGL